MAYDKPRKSVTLGEMCMKSDYKTKEIVEGEYNLKVWIPDDVDQAGIGQPSLVLTKESYLNFRQLSEEDLGKMPDWKKEIAQLSCWMMLGKKDA